jgi:uncharacterized protein YrrD
MQIAFGQIVASSDGHKLGIVDRILLDPAGSRIESIVVHRGIFLDHDKVIGRDAISSIDAAGIHLLIDAIGAEELSRFDHTYATEEVSAFPEVIPGPLQSLILVPQPAQYDPNEDAGLAARVAANRHAESGLSIGNETVVLGKGAEVIAADGERVGYLCEVSFDENGAIQQLSIETGLVRHHRLVARADQIAGVSDDEIELSVAAGALDIA